MGSGTLALVGGGGPEGVRFGRPLTGLWGGYTCSFGGWSGGLGRRANVVHLANLLGRKPREVLKRKLFW